MSKDQKNKLHHHHIISMVLTLTNQSSHLGELLYPHWSPLGFKFFFFKKLFNSGTSIPITFIWDCSWEFSTNWHARSHSVTVKIFFVNMIVRQIKALAFVKNIFEFSFVCSIRHD